LLLWLEVMLKLVVWERETVVVTDREGVTDCEAAVDTLDDLEVLLDWEGEGV
jgi:hypothetical protein